MRVQQEDEKEHGQNEKMLNLVKHGLFVRGGEGIRVHEVHYLRGV